MSEHPDAWRPRRLDDSRQHRAASPDAPTPEAECPCEGTGYIEVGTYQRARVICEEHFVPGDPNATGPAPIPATEGRSEGDLADALMSAVNRATRDRVHLDGEEADMVLRLLGPSPSAGTPAATEGRRDDDTVRVPR